MNLMMINDEEFGCIRRDVDRENGDSIACSHGTHIAAVDLVRFEFNADAAPGFCSFRRALYSRSSSARLYFPWSTHSGVV